MPRNYPVPVNGPIDATTGAQRDGVIFPSASRSNTGGDGSGNFASQEYVNPGAKGIRVFVSLTNKGAAGTLDLKIQNFDTASQGWMDVPDAAMTQMTNTGSAVFTLYPGQEEDSGSEITTPIGVRWRILATVGVNAVTFSVGADYLDR